MRFEVCKSAIDVPGVVNRNRWNSGFIVSPLRSVYFFYSCRRGERLTRRAVTFFFWQEKKLTKEKLPKFGDGLDARASGLCSARPNALAKINQQMFSQARDLGHRRTNSFTPCRLGIRPYSRMLDPQRTIFNGR